MSSPMWTVFAGYVVVAEVPGRRRVTTPPQPISTGVPPGISWCGGQQWRGTAPSPPLTRCFGSSGPSIPGLCLWKQTGCRRGPEQCVPVPAVASAPLPWALSAGSTTSDTRCVARRGAAAAGALFETRDRDAEME